MQVHVGKNMKQIVETFRLAARMQVKSRALIQELEQSQL